MNICHISTVHDRNDVRIFLKECNSLAAAGNNVFLVVSDGKNDEIENGIRILNVGSKPKNRLFRMLVVSVYAYVAAVKTGADIYHLHDPELIVVGLVLKLKGERVIYDVHEDLPRQILSKKWISPYFRKSISCVMELIENFFAKRFDAIVTATPFIRQRFVKINKNTINVNNYPILKEIPFCGDWNTGRDKLCYVGSITRTRGIVELIRAIELVNIKLVLAGKFSELGIEQEVRTLKGWKNVEYLGYVSRDKIRDILNTSCAGVVTLHPVENYIDSLPIKMFEYMAAGLPVIASNFPIWKNIIDSNNVGKCVDPMNPRAISSAIEFFINNKHEAQAMGRKGRKLVEGYYNWENEETKLIDLYNKLVLN